MATQAVFPVAYSTLDCKALKTQVLSLYSLGFVHNCQFWNRGLSDVYLIDALTARYVLRVSHAHWRTQSDIDFELEFLEFLSRQGLPVSRPLRTTYGELSVKIHAPEGLRYASVFTYAPGDIPLGDLSVVQAAQLGETVARLHEVAADFQTDAVRKPLDLSYLLDESFGIISTHMRSRPADLSDLRDIIAQIKRQVAALPQTAPYWSICWGDAHSGNVHFTPDNQLTLFDFDQCGYGWRAFEIAKFLQTSIRTGMARKVRDAFLSGYESVQKLTAKEVEAIQPLTQAAHLWSWRICLESALIHSSSCLDDYFFTKRLHQLKLLQTPEWQLF